MVILPYQHATARYQNEGSFLQPCSSTSLCLFVSSRYQENGNLKRIVGLESQGWHLPLFQARGRLMISEHAIVRLVWLRSFLPPWLGSSDIVRKEERWLLRD